jgi:hypothetical protein
MLPGRGTVSLANARIAPAEGLRRTLQRGLQWVWWKYRFLNNVPFARALPGARRISLCMVPAMSAAQLVKSL